GTVNAGAFSGMGALPWQVPAGTPVQAQSDNGYLLTNDSQQVTVTLPVSPNLSDIVRISGGGAGGWKIAQNAGQTVLGNFVSGNSVGANWVLTSAPTNDWIAIACSGDGKKLAAATDGGAIYLSSDSGAT